MGAEAIDKLAQHIANLKERWEDEKEYEPWEDYEKSILSQLPPGSTDVKISKRFVICWSSGGQRHTMRVTKTHVHYTRG